MWQIREYERGYIAQIKRTVIYVYVPFIQYRLWEKQTKIYLYSHIGM